MTAPPLNSSDADLIAARVMRRLGELLVAVGTLVIEGPMSQDPPAPAPEPPDTKPPLT